MKKHCTECEVEIPIGLGWTMCPRCEEIFIRIARESHVEIEAVSSAMDRALSRREYKALATFLGQLKKSHYENFESSLEM